ncbi:MAG: Extracellular solute-binding protein family 1 [Thermotogales bacterium 46_20]|nr:MAG: Extracellular solute-binding protein family 1 [Thermotogales bacterium 46_20]
MKFQITVFVILTIVNAFALGLTVWVSWEGEDFFRNTATQFESESGIKVDVLFVPRMEEKLQLSLRTGNLPDICLIKDTQTGNVAASGKAVSLSEVFVEDLGSFSVDSLQAFSLNDQLYAIPYYADLQVAYLNLSLAPSDFLSNTYEDYSLDDLEPLYSVPAANIVPVAWDFMSPYVFFSFLSGFGDAADSKGMPAFSSEHYRMAVEEVFSLFASGRVERLERQAMVSYFMDGKLAYMIQGSYLANQFEDAGIDFRMLPLPKIGGNEIPAVIDSKGFVLFNPDSLQEARAFLSFLYARSMEFSVANYKVPLWVELLPEELDDLEVVMRNTVRMPNDMRFQQIYSDGMRTVLQVVFAGSMSIEDALHSAQAYAEYNW